MTRSDSPIFVCGADRSGTSLTYALLASHPNISMVRRTNIWRWFHGKFGDLADPENLRRAIDTMRRYERMDVLEPDWDRVRAEFTDGPATYGHLFSVLHGQRAERVGRTRWGDKSLHAEHQAAAIFTEFPRARVIHMIRDPRDRHASIANRYEDREKRLASTTGRWLESVAAADSNQRRYGDRYRVVRYEDLARHPEQITRELCRFVDEPFVPSMLDMDGAPEHTQGNSSFDDLTPGTISTAPIGRYTTLLDADDLAFIQLTCGRPMRRLGYEVDEIEPRPLRARVSTPLNLGRLTAWSLKQRIGRPRERVPEHRLSGASR